MHTKPSKGRSVPEGGPINGTVVLQLVRSHGRFFSIKHVFYHIHPTNQPNTTSAPLHNTTTHHTQFCSLSHFFALSLPFIPSLFSLFSLSPPLSTRNIPTSFSFPHTHLHTSPKPPRKHRTRGKKKKKLPRKTPNYYRRFPFRFVKYLHIFNQLDFHHKLPFITRTTNTLSLCINTHSQTTPSNVTTIQLSTLLRA